MESYKVKSVKIIGKDLFSMAQLAGEKVLTVPNLLSLFRIFMIIPFAISFLKDDYVMSIAILALSGITDVLDGFIARKTNSVTKIGMVLDPFADKLTLISVMACLCIKFPELIPFVGIMLVKDVSMIIVGGVLLLNGFDPPAAKWYGKVSTAMFYVSVISLVFFSKICSVDFSTLTLVLFSLTTFFMLFALIRYFILCLSLIKS